MLTKALAGVYSLSMLIPLAKTHFLQSAAQLSQLPPDEGCEIAFAGRSNAGKSTALNTITGVRGLAKTSKIPGRTQLINLFQVLPHCRLVDLPGYGFARVPLAVKQRWERTLSLYLQQRQCLRGLCLLMDIRHPLHTSDQHMIDWAKAAELPMHILLTKADKLSRGAAQKTLHQIENLSQHYPSLTCQIFSALNGEGVETARKHLSHWLACCR